MPTMNELLGELTALTLPEQSYAVFGSGPLAVRGLREPNDLDIIVTQDLWGELVDRMPAEATEHGHGPDVIQVGNIEIWSRWYPAVGELAELIADADVMEGVRYVQLEKVIEWKQKRKKPKDLQDIILVQGFLSESHL